MKGRESGMPEEEYWASFFDVEGAIDRLFGDEVENGEDVVEFGCGYGTFTFPVARRVSGTVYTFDIEEELVERLGTRAAEEGLSNIVGEVRDFVADGTGLEDGSVGHVMIYNLLHIENPERMIEEAHRILRPGGRLSVMHWRSDIDTPRGPSLEIRPNAEQCIAWMEAGGFGEVREVGLEGCCEYHFGVFGTRIF